MPRKRAQDWGPGPYPHTFQGAIDSLTDDDMWDIYALSHQLAEGDVPHRSDIVRLFFQYMEGTDQFRRGVDAAFIWSIGYAFDSLIARWLVRGEENVEEAFMSLVEKWRKR